MLRTIRTYFEVYKKFVETSSAVAMSFRLSFVLLILMDLCFYFSSLMTVHFIYDHVSMIGPWSKDQLLFFLSFMLVIDNLHMTFISESFWELSFQLRTGAFDFVVLRPLGTVFSTFFRHFRPSTLLNFPVACFFLLKYAQAIDLSPLSYVLLPLMVILGFSLLLLVEFTLSTSMFWMTESTGINFLRMQLQQLSRWPHFIYSSLPRRVLMTVLPVLLVGSGPVSFLLEASSFELLGGMILSLVVFSFILKWLWGIGLRRYDSASS